MGTRAMITRDGEPFVATHWDGYPDILGAEILKADCKTPEEIIEVAKCRDIDFIHKDFLKNVNQERYEDIAAKTDGKYTADDIAELDRKGEMLSFQIQTSHDYPIGTMDNYGDWPDYQYDLRDGKWFFRSCSGVWGGDNFKSDEWIELTEETVREN